MIAFGIINCFLGYKFFKLTLFTVGFMVAFVIALSICSNLIGAFVPEYINWIAITISSLLGVLLGWFFCKFEKGGFFFLGGLGGYILGILFYEAFLHKLFDA